MTSDSTAAVELRGIRKQYGWWSPRTALQDVWLRVDRGECFGLAGPNGAGKTTLIRIVLGLSMPDEGEARLLGERPEDPEVRRRVGFVPELAELPGGASPRQLVRRWVQLRGLAPGAVDGGLSHLERLGLASLLDRPVGRFSKGERQRTLLALALLGDPELLVLDEPTDGLDPLGRALVRQVVREECAAGRTVFLNSHLLAETERICTRVGILHQGRLERIERLRTTTPDAEGTSLVLLEAPLSLQLLAEAGARAAPPASPLLRDLVRDRPGVQVLIDHRSVAELNQVLDRLRAHGAALVELHPVRADLEATLVEVTGGEAPTPLAVEPVSRGAPPWASTPAPPLPPVPWRPWRAVNAIRRAAKEIAAELASQRIGWMMLLLVFLAMAFVARLVQSHLLNAAASASREALQQLGALELERLSRTVASIAAQGLTWSLWGLLTVMSSLFAVPLLDPRRTVLIYAQPVSRVDHALGLFTGVVTLAGVAAFAYSLTLWLVLRWLGLPVSPQLLWVAGTVVVGFAPVYAVVLLATLVQRSGLFAAICGLAALVGSASLGSSDALSPDAPPSVWQALYAICPKLIELARLSGHLAEGAAGRSAPVLSTLLVAAALALVLTAVARRNES